MSTAPLAVHELVAYLPATRAMLDDAPWMSAWFEYRLLPKRPLSLRERLTGWQHFTASNGLALHWRVGWRATLYDVTHPVEWWKRRHPQPIDDYGDEWDI